ncbi:hypothetical protein J6590_048778 [Homalodisca vitripennis]|nr:hypothetical protein J6590_048778 [Homalodisca vitripennis]
MEPRLVNGQVRGFVLLQRPVPVTFAPDLVHPSLPLVGSRLKFLLFVHRLEFDATKDFTSEIWSQVRLKRSKQFGDEEA